MEENLLTVSSTLVTVHCHELLSMFIGTSPYVIDTSTLSRGEHTITFAVIVNGVVRGLANETFTVLEGPLYISML